MSGSLVDLSSPGMVLPSRLIVDSSIVIDWLVTTSRLTAAATPPTPKQHRAGRLVATFPTDRTLGLITPTSAAEVFHFVVKSRYRGELPNYRADLSSRFPTVHRHGWEHLYKTRSDLIRQFAPGLDRIRQLMDANGLVFLQPEDLGSIPSGRTLDDELVRTMERYELDSSDAAILIEARRAGMVAIATADSDWRRAQIDFDVYTWL